MPMILLVILEALLLTGTILGGGVFDRLIDNQKEILHEKVVNRKSYLENEMINNWSDVGLTVELINQVAKQMSMDGEIQLDTLDDSTENAIPFLGNIANELIAMLRSNRVTGVYIILNNDDLKEEMKAGMYQNKPGIYLRDADPVADASVTNDDLLFERGPISIVQNLDITTDKSWQPQFNFQKKNVPYYDFLYKPYQQAYQSINDNTYETYETYEYWSCPYALEGDSTQVIAYSVPLILESGEIYGVLGIEISLEYLAKCLPRKNAEDRTHTLYTIEIEKSGIPLHSIWGNSKENEEAYKSTEYLKLYHSNTPFVKEKWAVAGSADMIEIKSFSNDIWKLFAGGIIITLLIGIIGSIVVSMLISRPVIALGIEMRHSDPRDVVKLKRTHITEVDHLVNSIEQLSNDIVNVSVKFSEILKLASVKIAGFEIIHESDKLFVTDDFFYVFGLEGIDTKRMSVGEFCCIMDSLSIYYLPEESEELVTIFKVPKGKEFTYIKFTYSNDAVRCVGLAEDVTNALLEKKMIEHERDYDLLTGMMNRRAFQRNMKRLFQLGEPVLKVAALVMLDLDNLKYINDTYGHDCGDRYIRQAAESFIKSVPTTSIVSRISGDEFYVFLYGYNEKNEIQSILANLAEDINRCCIILPSSEKKQVAVSGGVAWYPDDSKSYELLLRYSDFAMYQMKQKNKGEMGDFDLKVYNHQMYLLQRKAELEKLIQNNLVTYYFQPIIEAKNGTIFAYEALMRTELPLLRNPMEVLEVAREAGRLRQIEVITWMNAMEAFVSHVKSQKIDSNCKVFINSLSDCIMTPKEIEFFEDQYCDYLSSVVLEVTEESEVNRELLEIKRKTIKKWNGEFALDDYGSGYNSEQTLLHLVPKYVKVDLGIIRNIDKDVDKQAIVINIVSYAHARNMYVVAEGIETRAEADKAKELNVDYLQGYYYAKPTLEPIKEITGKDL